MKAYTFWISFLACFVVVVLLGGIALFAIPSVQTKVTDSVVENSQMYKDVCDENETLKAELSIKNQSIVNLNKTITDNNLLIQSLDNSIIEKQTRIQSLTSQKEMLEIELNNANSDITDLIDELDLVNDELYDLQLEITELNEELITALNDNRNLNNDLHNLQEQIVELRNVIDAMENPDGIKVSGPTKRYDVYFRLNDGAELNLVDYENQDDTIVFDKSFLLRFENAQVLRYTECNWYSVRIDSLNINDQLLSAVDYIGQNSSSNITFIDSLTGETITSLQDFFNMYSDSSEFIFHNEFNGSIGMVLYTNEECSNLGYFTSEKYFNVKDFTITIELEAVLPLRNGTYLSETGKTIELESYSNHEFYANVNDNYGSVFYSANQLFFRDFSNGSINFTFGRMIAYNQFVWQDEVYTLTN